MERELQISEQNIADFISGLSARGRSYITIRKYNRILRQMYAFLPEEKMIRKDTFKRFLDHTLEERDYSNSSINSAITAYNEFVRFLGYGDFRFDRVEDVSAETPLLTKEDYYKLLEAAIRRKDRRAYVLIKLFANTPLRVHEMGLVTVEAVQEGELRPEEADAVKLGEVLRKDLLEYADAMGIRKGCIFRTNRNTPLSRHLVAKMISGAGQSAGFPEGYITPRCLQKYHSERIEEVRRMYEPVIQSAYEASVSSDQHIVAWKE